MKKMVFALALLVVGFMLWRQEQAIKRLEVALADGRTELSKKLEDANGLIRKRLSLPRVVRYPASVCVGAAQKGTNQNVR